MDDKKHIVNLESFRDMLHICPRVHGQSFTEPPFEEEILAFIHFLGHSTAIRTLTDVNINKLYQPWRSFAAIINKCLTKKSSGYDSLRLSQAQILWGLYHKRNIDYAYLLWEDFVYQAEHKNTKKSNEMYYPRFTKVIIHHFMSKDPSIPRRNKVNCIINSNAYKEYFAIATGAVPPKPKASVRRTKSSCDTSITPSTAVAGPRLTTSQKGKQVAKASKAKSLSALSEVAMTEAQQLKLATKRSRQHTHISHASGSGVDEGTGSIPGVPDVPTDESEKELSWNSTDDEGDANEGKDDDDDEDEGDDGQKGNGDDDDDDEDDDGEEGDDNDADQEVVRDDDKDDEEEGGNDENEFDNDESDKETRDEESFDPIPQTPENSDDKAMQSSSVSSQFVTSMLNPTLDVGMESIFETTSQLGVQTPTSVAPLPMTAPTMTPSTITIITTTNQALIIPTTFDRLRDEAQRENEEFLKTVDEKMQKIIKEQVKEQVKDEEPSAGPERGSKRRSKGKEPELASAPIETITRSAGRSTQGSRSRQASASESALAKEPMQTTSQIEEPSHPEFNTGVEDQPIVQSSQHPEWFSQQQKPPFLDRAWNKTVPAVHESIQPWISELAKQADTRSFFNELMDTPLDFSNFLINRLKVDALTPELLAGPTYELIKGSCKSLIELEYHLEEVFKATTDQLDWVNPEGQQYPHNLLKPLPLIPNNRGRRVIPFEHFINNDLEYLCGGYDKHALWGVSHWGRKCQQLYSFAINREYARDVYSKRRIIAVTELKIVKWQAISTWIGLRIVIQRRVEDLQLGVESYQKKLNLTKPDSYRSDLKRKEAYTAYSNPWGFIYQNKDKRNMLMWIDELHKFSDGTLIDVRTALDDHLKGIQMQYLPQSIWRKSDQDRAAAMVQAIDKRLKTKRIMRSLERFVGGRLYEGDFRMLQRTI
nr:hypothetical protein [Tanacetum cinerariifolium]